MVLAGEAIQLVVVLYIEVHSDSFSGPFAFICYGIVEIRPPHRQRALQELKLLHILLSACRADVAGTCKRCKYFFLIGCPR